MTGLLAGCAAGPGPARDGPLARDLTAFGIDPTSTLDSRIGDIPPDRIKFLVSDPKMPVASHAITPEDRRKIAAAFAYLTPLQKRVAQDRLRSISVADGMGGNASTVRVSCKDCLAFDLVINSIVLNETLSQFATRKERTLFDASGSTLNVSIDAGQMSALTFIVLHEFTHMVDMTLELTPQTAPGQPISEAQQTSFGRGIWATGNDPVAAYRTPLIDGARWRSGKTMRIEQATAYYEDLAKTPFPSSYATAMPVEDLPELLALNELTGKLKQPFRIEVRDGARVIASYEPMKNPLVRARLPLLARFQSPAYELPKPAASTSAMPAPRPPQ